MIGVLELILCRVGEIQETKYLSASILVLCEMLANYHEVNANACLLTYTSAFAPFLFVVLKFYLDMP